MATNNPYLDFAAKEARKKEDHYNYYSALTELKTHKRKLDSIIRKMEKTHDTLCESQLKYNQEKEEYDWEIFRIKKLEEIVKKHSAHLEFDSDK